jgi:hypothetical protein
MRQLHLVVLSQYPPVPQLLAQLASRLCCQCHWHLLKSTLQQQQQQQQLPLLQLLVLAECWTRPAQRACPASLLGPDQCQLPRPMPVALLQLLGGCAGNLKRGRHSVVSHSPSCRQCARVILVSDNKLAELYTVTCEAGRTRGHAVRVC